MNRKNCRVNILRVLLKSFQFKETIEEKRIELVYVSYGVSSTVAN